MRRLILMLLLCSSLHALQNISRDTFTRANSGTLGSNWTSNSGTTTTATCGITSNAAQVQTTAGRCAAFWSGTPSTFANNQYSEALAGCSATGTNNHLAGVTVRASSGDNYYLFTWNMSNPGSGNLDLAAVVGGTFHDLSTATLSPTCGQWIRLEVVGNVLTAFVGGTQEIQFTDTNNYLTSGAPGVTDYMAASSPTAFLTQWEGGDLVWTRQGTVEPATRNSQEPTVIYENGCVIVSSPCFKMWYTSGWISPVAVVNYAESTSGTSFTEYSSNPVISNGTTAVNHGAVVHVGSSYYAYYSNGSPSTELDLWQSSDGVTSWTLTHAAVITSGGAGTWSSNGPYNPLVWVEGSSNWFMLYTGENSSGVYSIGLATSPDGVTWTNYASNPVINSNGNGNDKVIYKFFGSYYLWTHGVYYGVGPNLPTDISVFTSTDKHTWTAASTNPIYERVLAAESPGPNSTAGQVADACIVQVGSTSYLYDDATDVQASGHIHINVATAPYTSGSLVSLYFTLTSLPFQPLMFPQLY